MEKNRNCINRGGKYLVISLIVSALIAGCGGGGDTAISSVKLSGTAAKGLPLANKTISIRDKNGNTVSKTTLADGTYVADVTNMTAPYLIKVDNLYSVATASGTANVHPFTDMIVRNWFKVQGSDVDTAFIATGAMPNPPTANDIATIQGVVIEILAPYMRGADVNPSGFNLITTPFNANHSGFDLLLDNLTVTQPATSGGNVTIVLAGGGSTGTILTVPESTSLTTLTPPPAPVSDTVAPAAPGAITPTRTSATQVVLSWGAASDNIRLAGYKIYRNGVQIGITDQPFYIDGAATTGASDCYTVSAYDAAGNKSGQNTQVCASATTVAADVTPPTAPGNLTTVAISSSQINLAWSASTDNVAVAGYRVMAGGAAIATLAANATTYSHTGLNESTQYSYTVVAIDTSGNASSSLAASATTSAKTDTTAPTAPSGVTATAASATQINLAWTASTDAVGVAGYNVYSGATLAGTSATASYSAVNLTASTQYCYTVKAYDAAGNVSAASAQVCQTTAATSTTQNTIVGGWTMDGTVGSGNLITFTFLANGEYLMTQDYVTIPPSTTLQPGGMERGTYSWNPATGAFRSLCPTVDTNGEAGASHPTPGICSGAAGTVTVSGNTLTLTVTNDPTNPPPFTFTRIADATNPAVGSWTTTSVTSTTQQLAVGLKEFMVILPNGEYVMGSSGTATNGTDGIERGILTWNPATGAVSLSCPTLDTNGTRGISNILGTVCGLPASQGATTTISASGDTISMVIPAVLLPVGAETVTVMSARVTSSNPVAAIPILLGGAIQGKPLNLTGTVTTIAGSVGVAGTADGTGTAAQFNEPRDITTDGTNLYVADKFNHTIRKIVIATGAVSTIAGSAGVAGTADGTGAAARFNTPKSITNDGTNLYVADSNNRTIRKVVIATGAVTTIAGTAGVVGSADGTSAAAQFNGLNGITTDGTSLYVADRNNLTVRKVVIATGVVTTIAGSTGVTGSADGVGTAALFAGPIGITTDGTNLYVVDADNQTIRKIAIATGAVTTIAGSVGVVGSADGVGAAASFSMPGEITTDGTNLYVADEMNMTVRKVVIATGAVTTIAGSVGVPSSVDGTGTAAGFGDPRGLTTDGTSLYVTDMISTHTIRKIQ